MFLRINTWHCLLALVLSLSSIHAQDKRARQLEKLIAGSEPLLVDGERVYRGTEVSKPPVILLKPEPPFGERARQHHTHGTVLIRAVLKSTGEVQVLYVLKGLKNGLTENALDAAKKIQFRASLVDGKPVSQIILLQYNFNLP